jgi:hypothetical protein
MLFKEIIAVYSDNQNAKLLIVKAASTYNYQSTSYG